LEGSDRGKKNEIFYVRGKKPVLLFALLLVEGFAQLSFSLCLNPPREDLWLFLID